ncbi:MAG: hypothetical protein A2X94_00545 [Bdellovibrionales bacterium GWB1_55_8]|nr:MAG: hypothetical protein A2X94_00545 [Bdellovibrionales bacterium GWB1_55_8]
MSDLDEIAAFTAVIKAGSFTGAARVLKAPKSTISRKVASLEDRLGVALIHRTTRKLHLTDVGTRYYRSCARILSELAEVEAAAKSAQEAARGLLRITAPVELGTAFLEEVLERYLQANKEVEVDLLFTDRVVDLIEEGVDVAIRAGQMADSSLVAKRIGSDEFRLVASPSYLKKAGKTPAHPRDLSTHSCLLFTTQSEGGTWHLENGKTHVEAEILSRVRSSSLGILLNLALRGEGIALLPTFMARDAIRTGKLVRVLPEWSSGKEPLYVVYPAQRFLPAKLKSFLAMLSAASEFKS